jgi:hypothetical protein
LRFEEWDSGFGELHQETEDSAFRRQEIVETGLVRNVCSSVSLSASDGRVWIGSSVKSFSVFLGRVSVVAFERGSNSGFHGSELRSIVVPSSAVVFDKWSLSQCKSPGTVMFESGSRLEQIEESAFQWSGLKSTLIPSSVVVLGKPSFHGFNSLGPVTFERCFQLEWIDRSVFARGAAILSWFPKN